MDVVIAGLVIAAFLLIVEIGGGLVFAPLEQWTRRSQVAWLVHWLVFLFLLALIGAFFVWFKEDPAR